MYFENLVNFSLLDIVLPVELLKEAEKLSFLIC